MTDARHAAERGTRWVASITAIMMIVEIWAGWSFNSMALLADGWHMSTHALAIGLSAVAYYVSRRYSGARRFAKGTRKIETLAAYSSALILLGVAAAMVGGSLETLVAPKPIRFSEAIGIAGIGLVVNVGCAFLLGAAHSHTSDHHDHRDLNLRSAYLHVVADAATSVLALVALAGGKLFGLNWLDPLMGIVGAILVAVWAFGLLRDSVLVLLDVQPLPIEHAHHHQ